MSDYIEREVIEKFIEAGLNNPDKNKAFGHDAIEILTEIHFMPAADVAPVVRCRECKHYKDYGKTSILEDGKHIKAGWCCRRMRYDEEYRMPADGFCSYGQRKEKKA